LNGWPRAGPNCFEWENGRLTFSQDEVNLSVVPSPDEWTRFWNACDEIGVWSWPPEVGDVDVPDGLIYELEIAAGSRSVKSRGQVVGSPPDFGEKLLKFHRALQALVGWLDPAGIPERRP